MNELKMELTRLVRAEEPAVVLSERKSKNPIRQFRNPKTSIDVGTRMPPTRILPK